MATARKLPSLDRPGGTEVPEKFWPFTPETDPWAQPLAPETQAILDRLVAEGSLVAPTERGPRTPFEPLDIPGFSLTDLLLEMRDEE